MKSLRLPLVVIVAYLVLLAAAAGLLVRTSHPAAAVTVVLLGLLAQGYIAWMMLQTVLRMDEMWRKILMEGMAFAGVATAFTCAGFPLIHDITGWVFRTSWVYYLFVAYSLVGATFTARRLR